MKRHSHFFKSLHQLEKRLASESRPSKKARIERKSEVGHVTTSPDTLAEHTNESAVETPEPSYIRSELTNAKDGGSTKLDAGICLLTVSSKPIYPDTICSYKTEVSFCQSNCINIAYPSREGNFSEKDDDLKENHANTIDNVAEDDDLLRDIISVSATDLKSIDEPGHIEECVERIAFSEGEGQTYDSMHSNDFEDSCSQLVFSTNWNAWGAPGNIGEFESNPPEEFLPTPSTADDFFGSFYSATQDHASQNDVSVEEHHHDDLQDLTDLCNLLSLDIDANCNEKSYRQADEGISKLPQSDFYSNVAKVQENDYSGYSGALDLSIHRLLESKTNPFSCALFIMAKASLNKDNVTSNGKSIEFPSIVKEWLNDQNWEIGKT